MTSKYDGYWKSKKVELAQLVKAAASGLDAHLDAAGICSYGKRASWSGSAIVLGRQVVDADMAHLRSLATVVADLGLCRTQPDRSCRFVMGRDGRLTARWIPASEPRPRERPDRHVVDRRAEASAIVDVPQACSEVHRLLETLPSDDGLYFFYERGEDNSHGAGQRIVRIGNHPRADHRLRVRLREHYRSAIGSKNASVLRILVGGALIRRDDERSSCLQPGPGLGHWERHMAPACPRCAPYENHVTEELRQNFSFRCVRIEDREERNRFERRLIATVSACDLCKPSPGWLGQYACHDIVRRSGLWNREFVGGQTLTVEGLARFRDLVRMTPGAADQSADLSRTLLLIPCSAGKHDSWDHPLGLPNRRVSEEVAPESARSLEDGRGEAFSRPKTCLREDSALRPALDYYSGNPYKLPGFRDLLIDSIRRGLHCLILSGGYGLLLPEEEIHNYEAPMFRTKRVWLRRLPAVLRDYVRRNSIQRTFAAFSQDYAAVVPEGLTREDWRAIVTYDPKVDIGPPLIAVPRRVGEALLTMLQSEFHPPEPSGSDDEGSEVASGRHWTTWRRVSSATTGETPLTRQ